MTSIQYLTGNAARPQGEGKKIIAHVCNNAGVWSGSFARVLGRAWPRARVAYKAWHKDTGYRLVLGTLQLVERRDSDVMIANMIAQRGIRFSPIQPLPIDYAALERCLTALTGRAHYFEASVHMPRFGHRARVEALLNQTLLADGVPVLIYTAAD